MTTGLLRIELEKKHTHTIPDAGGVRSQNPLSSEWNGIKSEQRSLMQDL